MDQFSFILILNSCRFHYWTFPIIKKVLNKAPPYSWIEEGNGNPLQYSCLGNPMDRGPWQAAVHGITKVGHEWALTPTTFKFKALNISTVFNLSVNQGEEKGISLKDLFTWINLSLTCGKSGQVMLNTLGPKSVVPAVDSSLPQSGSVSRVCWVSVSHVIRIPLSSDTVW